MGAASSTDGSTRRLAAHGIPVLDLNDAGELEVYVDGADEATRGLHLIKGGGGALLREKVLAQASAREVIVVDGGKLVDKLGARCPLPVEVATVPIRGYDVLPGLRQFVALQRPPDAGYVRRLRLAPNWTPESEQSLGGTGKLDR